MLHNCCPKCGKNYDDVYCGTNLWDLPDYIQIENYCCESTLDGHGYSWTVAIKCTKCGTEFRFYDGSY
jgi:hypothetical protein